MPPSDSPPSAGDLLVVLVDLQPHITQHSREIRAMAAEAYWRSTGSVVARLRRALAEANRHLARVNGRSEPDGRALGSITCAVLWNDELFVGQVGPGKALVYHPPGEVEIFPQDERRLLPLGAALPPVIHIGYAPLMEGSALFLATTDLAQSRSNATWVGALSTESLEESIKAITGQALESGASGTAVVLRGRARVEMARAGARPEPMGRRYTKPQTGDRPQLEGEDRSQQEGGERSPVEEEARPQREVRVARSGARPEPTLRDRPQPEPAVRDRPPLQPVGRDRSQLEPTEESRSQPERTEQPQAEVRERPQPEGAEEKSKIPLPSFLQQRKREETTEEAGTERAVQWPRLRLPKIDLSSLRRRERTSEPQAPKKRFRFRLPVKPFVDALLPKPVAGGRARRQRSV
ncbi:MAG: hypothetical protein ACP5GX_07400, partial [Anaerolineae bacterium]